MKKDIGVALFVVTIFTTFALDNLLALATLFVGIICVSLVNDDNLKD